MLDVANADGRPREPQVAGRTAVGRIAVVRLVDTGLVPVLEDIQRQLDAALREAPRVIAVDLSAVEDVSSTTIAALLWIRRRCTARGIELVLRRPTQRGIEALERLGLLGVLGVLRVESTTGTQGTHG
ncbi:STAS domain-containing protein [Nocardioides humi]|uniref:STAS domain-containing protein n=1 Tax=Nocardioides humi TaxID=449461 RepID=UPI0015E84089|nr:STAS domain-containing protein [Nocardioides humi]